MAASARKFPVGRNSRFLCIGDSITDCGRRKEFPPLGNGYVRHFNTLLQAAFPDLNVQVLNKGIGGNTILDLKQRWEDDVTYHRPDWLSVLIGINDLHHVLRGAADAGQLGPDRFLENYRELLDRATREVGCRMILLEPFYLSTDRTDGWRGRVLKELRPYRQAVARLSREFKAPLVRLQDIFEAQLKERDPETLGTEPVHPNEHGHLIIAWNLFRTLSG
ncbi:MAG TPA: SGNH/GDSL hydrolase family protein [bacterium]|nr:SGNH/GDSL hydrolase family protein [bacterium]HNS48265.1 SGNH/GDSL hydrolase family protein [bacterium]